MYGPYGFRSDESKSRSFCSKVSPAQTSEMLVNLTNIRLEMMGKEPTKPVFVEYDTKPNVDYPASEGSPCSILTASYELTSWLTCDGLQQRFSWSVQALPWRSELRPCPHKRPKGHIDISTHTAAMDSYRLVQLTPINHGKKGRLHSLL